MVVAFYFRLHLAYFPRPVVAIFARPEQFRNFRLVSRFIHRWQLLFLGYLMYFPEWSKVSPSKP